MWQLYVSVARIPHFRATTQSDVLCIHLRFLFSILFDRVVFFSLNPYNRANDTKITAYFPIIYRADVTTSILRVYICCTAILTYLYVQHKYTLGNALWHEQNIT